MNRRELLTSLIGAPLAAAVEPPKKPVGLGIDIDELLARIEMFIKKVEARQRSLSAHRHRVDRMRRRRRMAQRLIDTRA